MLLTFLTSQYALPGDGRSELVQVPSCIVLGSAYQSHTSHIHCSTCCLNTSVYQLQVHIVRNRIKRKRWKPRQGAKRGGSSSWRSKEVGLQREGIPTVGELREQNKPRRWLIVSVAAHFIFIRVSLDGVDFVRCPWPSAAVHSARLDLELTA